MTRSTTGHAFSHYAAVCSTWRRLSPAHPRSGLDRTRIRTPSSNAPRTAGRARHRSGTFGTFSEEFSSSTRKLRLHPATFSGGRQGADPNKRPPVQVSPPHRRASLDWLRCQSTTRTLGDSGSRHGVPPERALRKPECHRVPVRALTAEQRRTRMEEPDPSRGVGHGRSA
jgi:hypothetical protein